MQLFVVKINATWAGCFKQSLQTTKGNAKYCDLVEVMLHGIWQIFKDGKCLCLLMCWLGITSFVCQASTVGFVRNGWLGLRLWLLTLFSRSSSPPPLFFFPGSVFVFLQLHSGSPCLLGHYPSTAGTESICQAPNLLRCNV